MIMECAAKMCSLLELRSRDFRFVLVYEKRINKSPSSVHVKSNTIRNLSGAGEYFARYASARWFRAELLFAYLKLGSLVVIGK